MNLKADIHYEEKRHVSEKKKKKFETGSALLHKLTDVSLRTSETKDFSDIFVDFSLLFWSAECSFKICKSNFETPFIE